MRFPQINPFLFIKSFVNLFAGIALTFFDVHLIHFQQVHFLFCLNYFFCLNFFVYHQNRSFFEISNNISLAKLACANLAGKHSDVNLLNYEVVIYLLWSRILFSATVRAVVVAKLITLGILLLNSFILALRVVLVANLVISGILSSTFLILTLYTSFLTMSLFTTSLSLL